jgi:hypothetical protein
MAARSESGAMPWFRVKGVSTEFESATMGAPASGAARAPEQPPAHGSEAEIESPPLEELAR